MRKNSQKVESVYAEKQLKMSYEQVTINISFKNISFNLSFSKFNTFKFKKIRLNNQFNFLFTCFDTITREKTMIDT